MICVLPALLYQYGCVTDMCRGVVCRGLEASVCGEL